MRERSRQHVEGLTLGALELLARRDLDRGFGGRVRDEEVHREILAVHVIVDPRLDVARHHVGVQVAVVLWTVIRSKVNIQSRGITRLHTLQDIRKSGTF